MEKEQPNLNLDEIPRNLLTRIEQVAPQIAHQLIQALPELHSVALVFEWDPILNDELPAGVWANKFGVVGAENNPVPPDGCALKQTLRMLELQQTLLRQRLQHLEHLVRERSRLLQQVTEKLDDQKARWQAAGQEFSAASGGSGDVAGPASAVEGWEQ